MKIAVIGDSGTLGQAIARHYSGKGWEVLGISSSEFKTPYRRERVDLPKEFSKLIAALDSFKPDLVINTVAIVSLEKCEADYHTAHEINASVASGLADYTNQKNIAYVHISTDQVFDGKSGKPYTETDAVNPLNAYGKTKLEAERSVLEKNPKALVVRTNLVGFRNREGRPAFAEWISQALVQKDKITLFEDYVTSSMHVRPLAEWIDACVEKKVSGVLNLATRDGASKYEFGKALAEELGCDLSGVTRGRLQEADLKPLRPLYLALNVDKAEKLIGKKLPTLRETVRELANDYKQINAVRRP